MKMENVFQHVKEKIVNVLIIIIMMEKNVFMMNIVNIHILQENVQNVMKDIMLMIKEDVQDVKMKIV